MKILILLLVLLASSLVFAHGTNKHEEVVEKTNEQDLSSPDEEANEISAENLKAVNELYISSVKPIFKAKCLDCHGSGNNMPWYYVLPGIKQLMIQDIEEAKEHMDMSNNFPFGGHGGPLDDLESLEKTVNEDSMPPVKYKVMHWNSSLTDEDKKNIKNWINKSLKLINNKKEK